jgi:Arc/MetJ family transcription regulator
VIAMTPQGTRRVTLNVDDALLREAGEALGTDSMTEAINRSLEETVQAHRRMKLAKHRFEDLDLETLLEMRRAEPT